MVMYMTVLLYGINDVRYLVDILEEKTCARFMGGNALGGRRRGGDGGFTGEWRPGV